MVCGPSPLLPITNEDKGAQRDPLFETSEAEAVRIAKELTFPANFIFSSATSAYQVEGGIVDTNWNRWEQQKRRKDGGETVKRGEGAGMACDMWNLFLGTDLQLIKQLGLGSFRFSVEWSRVEPSAGNYDEAALARYVDWCRELRANGIEPCVTLLHFTEPGWFVDLGGWEKRANTKYFIDFCCLVVDRLHPHCSMWCTLNEPVGCAVNGWLAGIHPPGQQGSLRTTCQVLFHTLLGHRDVSKHIRSKKPTGGFKNQWIMIANNIVWFESATRWNPFTRLLAFCINMLFNFCVTDLCTRGRLTCLLDVFFCLFGCRKDFRSLAGTVDTIGVNNYARVQLSMSCCGCLCPKKEPDPYGVRASKEEEGVSSGEQNVAAGCITGDPHNPRFEMSDMEWDLCPSSLGKALRAFWGRYTLPMLVTESGIADEGGIRQNDVAAGVKDSRRVRYLSGCLRAVHAAIADGVDVRGYTYWSLLDNFEWAEGYRPRFGLYRVNYENMTRSETGGLRLYREVIAKHRNQNAGPTAKTSQKDSATVQVDGVTSDDGTAVTDVEC